jgi:hypothetical protein
MDEMSQDVGHQGPFVVAQDFVAVVEEVADGIDQGGPARDGFPALRNPL